jgi:hypothetical protein
VHDSSSSDDDDDNNDNESYEEEEDDTTEDNDEKRSQATTESSSSKHTTGTTGRRALFDSLRHSTANKLRKLANSTAIHIAKMPLRIDLTFKTLEGTLCAWLPPPPGDRMFYAFLNEPQLSIKAVPQLSGRILKFSYHASRASRWIEARMALAFTKNMVYPAGGDIPLPLLFDSDNPFVATPLGDAVLRHVASHRPSSHDDQSNINEDNAGNEQQHQEDEDDSSHHHHDHEKVEAIPHQRVVAQHEVDARTQDSSSSSRGDTAAKPFIEVKIGRSAS